MLVRRSRQASNVGKKAYPCTAFALTVRGTAGSECDSLQSPQRLGGCLAVCARIGSPEMHVGRPGVCITRPTCSDAKKILETRGKSQGTLVATNVSPPRRPSGSAVSRQAFARWSYGRLDGGLKRSNPTTTRTQGRARWHRLRARCSTTFADAPCTSYRASMAMALHARGEQTRACKQGTFELEGQCKLPSFSTLTVLQPWALARCRLRSR